MWGYDAFLILHDCKPKILTDFHQGFISCIAKLICVFYHLGTSFEHPSQHLPTFAGTPADWECVVYHLVKCNTLTDSQYPAPLPVSSASLLQRNEPGHFGPSTWGGSACEQHPITKNTNMVKLRRINKLISLLCQLESLRLFTLLMGPFRLERVLQVNSLFSHSGLFRCSASREHTRVCRKNNWFIHVSQKVKQIITCF